MDILHENHCSSLINRVRSEQADCITVQQLLCVCKPDGVFVDGSDSLLSDSDGISGELAGEELATVPTRGAVVAVGAVRAARAVFAVEVEGTSGVECIVCQGVRAPEVFHGIVAYVAWGGACGLFNGSDFRSGNLNSAGDLGVGDVDGTHVTDVVSMEGEQLLRETEQLVHGFYGGGNLGGAPNHFVRVDRAREDEATNFWLNTDGDDFDIRRC